ncbi:MAG: ribulose-phosphate 3-epimerase [Candidatus Anstonellales archaeon]
MSRLRIEIVPAILVKSREELLKKIEIVKPYVKKVQIDVMDGVFVPNKTIGIEELRELPKGIGYEFHWMVNEPEKWMEKIKGNFLHSVHIEAKMNFERVKEVAKRNGGRVGIAINPPTAAGKIFEYEGFEEIMVMAVNPGFSNQKYIESVEEKIRILRSRYPKLNISVDGGINVETIGRAARAGANKFYAASAIFSADNPREAIEKLRKEAEKHA